MNFGIPEIIFIIALIIALAKKDKWKVMIVIIGFMIYLYVMAK